jgi:hypothetical protein
MTAMKLVDGVLMPLSEADLAQLAIDAATPLSFPSPAPSPREWLERLSADKQAAIAAAGVGNGTILLWLLKAAGSPSIDITNAETIAGVAALVAAGVITTADQTILLTP